MNSKINPALVLLALLFGLTSCGYLFGPTEKEGINNVCYLDISSSDTANLNLRLADMRDKLLGRLGPKDALRVMAIDKASLTAAIPLFEVDLASQEFENPAFPPHIQGDMADKARAAFVDSVALAFADVLRAGVASRIANNQSTDILGALRQAVHYVKPERVNRLFLFSDMLNDSEELNLDELCKQGADFDKAMQVLPTLHLPYDDICVFTGDNSSIKPDYFSKINDSWSRYFHKHGVPIRVYTSGGISTDLAHLP